VTKGLAIISLVCVYLLWENFKMTSKLRYLESSIHETVQTVQSLVNNSVCLPPRPKEVEQIKPQTVAQPVQTPQSKTQTGSPVKEEINTTESSSKPQIPQNNIFGNILGSLLQNNPLISMMSNLGQEQEPVDDDEEYNEDDENDEESEIEEIFDDENEDEKEKEEPIEPLEMSDELKNQINSLEFADGEIVELKEEDEEATQQPEETFEIEGIEELEGLEGLENFDETISKEVNNEHHEHHEDVLTTQEHDESSEKKDESYEETPELLNHMTVKQLQDIAEKYKLGKRGTKEQLLTKIKRTLHEKH
jgi:hypothetical protein